jgi:hypothetical protein
MTPFVLIFLLFSFRVLKSYKIDYSVKYPWKEQAAIFDPQGKVLYSFPQNPYIWTVSIPSSTDRNSYIPRSLKKISIDTSRIIEMNDLVVHDSLYTVTGPNPHIHYILPEKPFLSYCWLDFDRPVKFWHTTLTFIYDEPVPKNSPEKESFMRFYIAETNLLKMNEQVETKRISSLYVYFSNDFAHTSSFMIKRFDLYTSSK